MKIKWLPVKSGKPLQIYSTGLEYCFINGENEQCHEFVYCKDFLQDAVYGFLNEKVASIYSFTYNPKTMPSLLLEKTKIALVNNSDKDFLKKIDNVVEFINQFEAILKLKKTKSFVCDNYHPSYPNGTVVLQSSARWQEAAPMLSLYTLLIRLGFLHVKGKTHEETMADVISGKIKPYQTNDRSYLTGSKTSIDKILKDGYRKIFYSDIKRNYPPGIDINTMHNSFGIVAFTQGNSKNAVPGWFKKKKAKKKVEAVVES